MKLIIDEKFKKSLPKDDETNKTLLAKIDKFVDEISRNAGVLNNLSKGFYCRKVRAVENRYKFRINNGDRIVFQYDDDSHSVIRLLRYCKHDDQIVASIRASASKDRLELMEEKYEEDAYDALLDEQISKDVKGALRNVQFAKAIKILLDNNRKDQAKTINRYAVVDSYMQKMQKAECSQLLISVDGGRSIRGTDIKYALNRLLSETRLLLCPIMSVSVMGTMLNVDVVAYDAITETDRNRYMDKIYTAIMRKIGVIYGNEAETCTLVIETPFKNTSGEIAPPASYKVCASERKFFMSEDLHGICKADYGASLHRVLNASRLIDDPVKTADNNLSFILGDNWQLT